MVTGRARLVLYSALMLFTELGLIRWLGSNVFYLSFFSNFVLLGSFLGIGTGFLRARGKRDLSGSAPVALALLIVVVGLKPVTVQRSSAELIFFGAGNGTAGLPAWVALPFIFLATAVVMAGIGEGVARTFTLFEPLQAYRLDICGSLAGIVAFSVLAFLWAPPVAWGIVVAVGFVLVHGDRRPLRRPGLLQLLQGAALVAIVAILVRETVNPTFSWSPYYKITELQTSATTENIQVNGIPHQDIIDFAREPDQLNGWRSWPYQDAGSANRLDNVLIVGAGNGNDTAMALIHGAKHVDAVEIDPKLYQIGVDKHPAHPYSDPRVNIHITDGRAFLEHTEQRYDLIIFALPDSLTLVSGQASLRLESYLFTQESMQTARDHLKPGGAFSMYNFYRQPWLVDRLAGTLQTVYGTTPCLRTFASSAAVMTDSATAKTLQCATIWHASGDVPAPAHDDYPFLYLRSPGVPPLYIWTLLPIALASLLFVRLAGGRLRPMAKYTDLFFMGGAFLLLETKSVVQFALLFGTTWFVNALVFMGVLVAVLAAIEISRRWTARRPILLYGVLLAALAVAWVVPPEDLLKLDFVPRVIAAVAIAFTPILIANLIFAQRFKSVGESVTAFGANLLGAMLGGILEYTSMITGYRTLLILVAVLYGLALLTGRTALQKLAATRLAA